MIVQSTVIRDIGYDDRQGKLTLRFSDGDTYVYVGAPETVHRSLLAAPSKGRFFFEAIRDR